MRSILVATAVLAAPLTAAANPIYRYDFVDVQYEGTVDSIQPWGGGFPRAPKVGDRVSGTLRIDLHLVPAQEEYPDDPTQSNWYASDSYGIPSFVTGYAPATQGHSADYLSIGDGVENGDVFSILDQEDLVSGPFGHQRVRTDGLSLFVSSKTLDFIHGGDSALQAFMLTADSIDFSLGQIQETRRRVDEAPSAYRGGLVNFIIDKITATPGQCSR